MKRAIGQFRVAEGLYVVRMTVWLPWLFTMCMAGILAGSYGGAKRWNVVC